MTMPTEYTQQLFAYLQAWRQYLEQATSAVAPGQPWASGPWAMPAPPMMAPLLPPMPPAAGSPMMAPPADYTQQLLTYLQAWRQYLEQAMGTAPGLPAPATTPPTPPPAMRPAPEPLPPGDEHGSGIDYGSHTDRRSETARPAYEPPPRAASLYGLGRPTSLSEPAREGRPGSAYPTAAKTASSGAPAHAAPQSLYSAPAAGAASATWWESGRGFERRPVSNDMPDEIELVAPSEGQSKGR
jgi:hypothetical protein